mmetsp:Transcript_95468/g.204864  ORF Transcript_95468/g.204864 Transcript_95468/m.204864 type:complete len:257 (+) Transcript_95468:330-1100(+)
MCRAPHGSRHELEHEAEARLRATGLCGGRSSNGLQHWVPLRGILVRESAEPLRDVQYEVGATVHRGAELLASHDGLAVVREGVLGEVDLRAHLGQIGGAPLQGLELFLADVLPTLERPCHEADAPLLPEGVCILHVALLGQLREREVHAALDCCAAALTVQRTLLLGGGRAHHVQGLVRDVLLKAERTVDFGRRCCRGRCRHPRRSRPWAELLEGRCPGYQGGDSGETPSRTRCDCGGGHGGCCGGGGCRGGGGRR